MSFALPLSLGVVGTEEIFEFDLRDEVEPDHVHERLGATLPAGLGIRSVEPIPVGKRQAVEWVEYRLALPAGRVAATARAAVELMARQTCPIVRSGDGRERTIDIRPYLVRIEVAGSELVVQAKVTPKGTARPREIVEALGLSEALTRGPVLRRERVVLA